MSVDRVGVEQDWRISSPLLVCVLSPPLRLVQHPKQGGYKILYCVACTCRDYVTM